MAGDARGTDHEDPARPGAPPAPLALYRKYRPATFAEVKGQEHVTEPLRQALRSGRVHHAYLFSGPRGCGKTSSARILARSLNCEQGPTPDPCGVCPSCVALAPSGPGSIDVIEIDAASHGGVDDARDLRERAFYAPVSGRFKIYIIDEAHMVTREGFNALLRLVEEPPPHLKFVFATTEPEKVIPTIRSRTHHYPFRLVPPAVLRELLQGILAAEGVRCEPAVLPLVVRAGAGSARDSLSVLDQLLAGATEDGLTYERTAALLGYTDDSLLDEMIDAFAAGDSAAAFGTLDRVMEAGHDPRRFATDLLDRFRDLIILASVPGAGQTGLLDAPADRLERMAEQSGRFGRGELTRAAGILSDCLTQMRGTTSPRLLLELACAQALLPGAHTGEQALLARVERLERRLEAQAAGPAHSGGTAPPRPQQAPAEADESSAATSAGTAGPASKPARAGTAHRAGEGTAPSARAVEGGGRPRPATAGEAGPRAGRAAGPASSTAPPHERPAQAPAAAGPVDAGTLRERWPEVLAAVKAERRVAWMLLNSATVESLEDGVLTIAFAREGEARGFTSSGHDQVVERVLSAHLGRKARVKAVVNPGAAGPAGQGPASGRMAAQRERERPAHPPRPANPATSAQSPGAAQGPGQVRSTQDRAPSGDPPAPRPRSTQGRRPRPASPPAPASSFDENEWPDDAGTPEGARADSMSGMDLIRHQLGGEIIEEIEEN